MNRIEYASYKKAVNAFFEREGIVNLSGDGEVDDFSHNSCECCSRPEGGSREKATGVVEGTGDVFSYDVCPDCIYFAEYGRLDDQTMLDIQDEPVPLVMIGGEPVRYDLVPTSHMVEGIRNYIEHGMIQGSFLMALLGNDLFGVYRTADQQNLRAVGLWVNWLYNYSPSNCYGSKERIEEWCIYRKGEIE